MGVLASLKPKIAKVLAISEVLESGKFIIIDTVAAFAFTQGQGVLVLEPEFPFLWSDSAFVHCYNS